VAKDLFEVGEYALLGDEVLVEPGFAASNCHDWRQAEFDESLLQVIEELRASLDFEVADLVLQLLLRRNGRLALA